MPRILLGAVDKFSQRRVAHCLGPHLDREPEDTSGPGLGIDKAHCPLDYAANAAAIALFGLAASGLVAGLGAVLGRAGIGLGELLVFLVGNPLSAVSPAPELLPQPWGEAGQWLPVGAGATLLRSAAYFDWAGGTQALWVLSGTALLGPILVAVGRAAVAEAPEDPAREAVRKLADTFAV